jgi:hypothetical protein
MTQRRDFFEPYCCRKGPLIIINQAWPARLGLWGKFGPGQCHADPAWPGPLTAAASAASRTRTVPVTLAARSESWPRPTGPVTPVLAAAGVAGPGSRANVLASSLALSSSVRPEGGLRPWGRGGPGSDGRGRPGAFAFCLSFMRIFSSWVLLD